MSETSTSKRRRTVSGGRMTGRVNVMLDVPTAERLDELSERYGVARGTIAREAIGAGLRAVHERLRRAARSAAREQHAEERAAEASG